MVKKLISFSLFGLLTCASAAPAGTQLVEVSESKRLDLGMAWTAWMLTTTQEMTSTEELFERACTVNQAGRTLFLLGLSPGEPRTELSCTVPKGKQIMFPVLNVAVLANSLTACVDGLKVAKDSLNLATIDDVRIDGKSVDAGNTRATSRACLNAGNNVWFAIDGNWLVVKFDQPGAHTLSIRATSNSFTQEMTYKLTQE